MIKKIISVVLCFSFIVSLVTVYTPVARAVGGDIDIYTEDGACVTSLTLDYYEKTTLTAVARDFDIIDCQWQFLLGGRSGIWVDIYDMTEPVCELSRAVVGNMLDSDGEAYIRCIVDYDGGAYYSDAVTVTVGKPDVSDPPHVSSFVSMPVAESGLVSFESDVSVYTPVKRTYMTDGSDLIDGHAEDVEYVTVTIKYLDEASLTGEEGAIYSPYVATIEKGSAFSQTVVSPTFIGFAPYYDSDTTDGDTEADDDASSITFNYDAVNENIEIKVYYKPIEVDFAIKYFFQNINDDLYTEDLTRFHSGKALTGTIISDEYIKEKAGNTVGFEKMYHIPESVAADGSTVFECYYDRKYYLLQFDLNGGYGVDPIYARYGTAFIVNSPIKHGYQFMGWDLLTIDSDSNGVPDKGDGVVNDMDATIPAENRYYKAVWQSVDTSYNVVYWVQNPDDPDTVAPGDAGATLEFIGSRKVGEKSGAIVSGYNDLSSYNVYVCGNYTHTHTSACKSDVVLDRLEYYGADTNVLVDGDGSTVVNVYYRYNQYKLRFIFAKTDITSTIASNHTHWVVGGTTYPFGTYINQTAENTPLETLLENVTQWGQVTVKTTRNTGMPITDGSGSQLTDANGNKLYYGTPEDMVSDSYKNYISGGIKPISIGSYEYTSSGTKYRYYYIEFDARYGQCLESLWPIGMFNAVDIVGQHKQTNLKTAYFSAWNGEFKVKYTQDNASRNNKNETIKGCYMYLDDNLLYKSGYNYTDNGEGTKALATNGDKVVNYLGFWDNGADVSWSIPKLYLYKLWTKGPDGNYILYKVFETYDDSDTSDLSKQTPSAINGYTFKKRTGGVLSSEDLAALSEEAKLVDTKTVVNFYYDPNPYSLTFNSMNNVVGTSYTENCDVSLSKYAKGGANEIIVPYPSTLEENAYYFDGWYTTPACYDGSEFNLESEPMSPYDLTLYAKWTPKQHKVNFFVTHDDMVAYEDGDDSISIHYSKNDVVHGTVVGSVENPVLIDQSNMQLIFAGWFYIENGQKKAFAPLDMPITRDINLFADWSSSQPQPYRIDYKLLSDRTTPVADHSTGFAYGGSTRTFVAKAGNPYNQLYPGYNSGYFPTVGSHSITIQYEEDKTDPQNNVYTFYYVQAQNIKYTIRYVNKENNTLLEEEVVKITGDAVVTERFKAFENMVPDAFYKRLVISVEEDENGNYVGTEDNVITFYYTPNTTSAYYAVHFMLENIHDESDVKDRVENYYIDGTGGYTSTGTHLEGIGDVGKNVSITPQSFPGFTLVERGAAKTLIDGKETVVNADSDGNFSMRLDDSGSELYLFYKRNSYKYTVHHYIYNTTTPVSLEEAPTEPGEAVFGSTVTVSAKPVSGYTCVSVNTTVDMEIKANDEQNVVIFYYSPLQYVAEYVAVPSEGGWLSNTIEVVTGNQELSGSVPTAGEYYEFAGWYLDEACTQSADAYGTVDAATGRFTPDKSKLSETDRNIFYAKFNSRAGNLTIKRAGAESDGQVFVYEVRNNTTGDVIYVTIKENGSVTINEMLFGQYTVTQLNGWSWRYTDVAVTVSHSNVNGTTVQFGKDVSNEKWLNGNGEPVCNVRGAE